MSRTTHIGIIALLALGVVIAIAAVKLGPGKYRKYVIGATSCMAPTINSGELIYIKPFDAKKMDGLKRYEIVLFRAPMAVIPEGIWVMRVVGLPGDQVEIRTNSLLINGSEVAQQNMPPVLRDKQWLPIPSFQSPAKTQWTLGVDEVFVVGDNLAAANESRFWVALKLSR